MRRLSILAAAAGCSSEPQAQQPLDIDVVVAKQRAVVAYLNGSDYTDSVGVVDGAYQFPTVDTCVDADDAILLRPTCLQRVAFVGAGFQHDTGDPSLGFGISVFPPDPLPDDFALELEGCGDLARIPIEGSGAALPTVGVQTAGDSIHVVWTSDQPWDSALVTFSTEFSAHICHTRDSQYTFDGYAKYVSVTLFDRRDVIDESWGEARVWRGASANVDVPSMMP